MSVDRIAKVFCGVFVDCEYFEKLGFDDSDDDFYGEEDFLASLIKYRTELTVETGGDSYDEPIRHYIAVKSTITRVEVGSRTVFTPHAIDKSLEDFLREKGLPYNLDWYLETTVF